MTNNIIISSNFNKNTLNLLNLSEKKLDNIKIAVAVSGGSDSLALSLLINNFVNPYNGNIIAITIDHGLREESRIEAQKVHAILSQFGIKHQVITWEGEKPKANIQEIARIARYNLLTEYCKQNGIKYLATGHQRNDQAENFLIRLERGSGIYGLSGIPNITEYNDITIIRPLLEFKKEDLQEFLKSQNCEWIEDPSNQKEQFARVRMRKILNANTRFIDNLPKISEHLLQVKKAIEYYVNLNYVQLIKCDQLGIANFDLAEFNLLPQEIRFRIIEKLLQQVSRNNKPARGERIAKLLNKIATADKFKAATLSDCLIYRKKNLIFVTIENKP